MKIPSEAELIEMEKRFRVLLEMAVTFRTQAMARFSGVRFRAATVALAGAKTDLSGAVRGFAAVSQGRVRPNENRAGGEALCNLT